MSDVVNSEQATSKTVVQGRWLVVIAAVLWSTSGLFAKAPWLLEWPAESRGLILAFWRTLFAGLFLLPFVRRPQWTWALIPVGLVFAFMSFAFLSAVVKTTAANAIWLQNTAPLWVMLLGALCLGDRPQRADWLMLVPILCGVSLIVGCELSVARVGAEDLEGIVWALASGLAYATVVVFVRALRHLDAAWLIAWNQLLTAVVLLPFVLRAGTVPTAAQLTWVAAFGALQMGTPYVLFARALRSIPGHQAAFIVLLEPILVPVWVWLFWRSDPSYRAPQWWTFAGGALILVGLAMRFLRRPPTNA